MNINDIFNISFLSGQQIIVLFFKAFSLVFSFMYFIYSIIVYRQTQIMLNTIQVNDKGILERQNIILLISVLELILGFGLLIFSVIILSS